MKSELHPWHKPLWKRFGQMLTEDRLPHAVMLTGSGGIGKGHLAQALAERVLCQAGPDQQPCGQCRSCQMFAAGSHPDLMQVQPEEKSQFIKIDQVRELGGFLANKAHVDEGYKVVILKPAEGMNVNAANALLKNLEEPAGRTLMILVSHQSSGVMATIRSRCQLLVCHKPDHDEGLEWLSARLDSKERAEELLALSGGAPLSALALLSDDGLEQRRVLLEDLAGLLEGRVSPLAVAARWQSYEIPQIIDCLLKWLPMWSRGLATEESIQQNLQGVMDWLRVDQLQPLLRFYQRLQDTKRQLQSGSNPNKQLLLETLLMQWVSLRA